MEQKQTNEIFYGYYYYVGDKGKMNVFRSLGNCKNKNEYHKNHIYIGNWLIKQHLENKKVYRIKFMFKKEYIGNCLIKEVKKEIRDKLKHKINKCDVCGRGLVAIGTSRQNGTSRHSDWITRTTHKSCNKNYSKRF